MAVTEEKPIGHGQKIKRKGTNAYHYRRHLITKTAKDSIYKTPRKQMKSLFIHGLFKCK